MVANARTLSSCLTSAGYPRGHGHAHCVLDLRRQRQSWIRRFAVSRTAIAPSLPLLSGAKAERVLEVVAIAVNKNTGEEEQ